jgi:hypothetical protein
MQVCRRDHPWDHRSWSADEVPKVGEVVRTRKTVLPEHYADRETVVVEVRALDHDHYEIGLELSGAHARTWFTPDELTTPLRGVCPKAQVGQRLLSGLVLLPNPAPSGES